MCLKNLARFFLMECFDSHCLNTERASKKGFWSPGKIPDRARPCSLTPSCGSAQSARSHLKAAARAASPRLMPVQPQEAAAAKGRELSRTLAVVPARVLLRRLSDRSSLCPPSSPQAQAEVAQLPELPPAQPQLGVAADQLPVRGTDEPAAEVLPPEADCSPGEVHAFQQARLQLVRALSRV